MTVDEKYLIISPIVKDLRMSLLTLEWLKLTFYNLAIAKETQFIGYETVLNSNYSLGQWRRLLCGTMGRTSHPLDHLQEL